MSDADAMWPYIQHVSQKPTTKGGFVDSKCLYQGANAPPCLLARYLNVTLGHTRRNDTVHFDICTCFLFLVHSVWWNMNIWWAWVASGSTHGCSWFLHGQTRTHGEVLWNRKQHPLPTGLTKEQASATMHQQWAHMVVLPLQQLVRSSSPSYAPQNTSKQFII